MGIVVVGGQWGDEGKGRIVDSLAIKSDVIVRFQGGNNAGHSLHFDNKSLVLHLIPCGIVRPDKVAVIGNGVVIDPEILFEEIANLKKLGLSVSPDNLKISESAHIIFSYHKKLDAKREQGLQNIGTTKRGIGPCYEDKIARFGIRTRDLLSKEILKNKILNNKYYRGLNDDVNSLVNQGYEFGQMLKPFLCDTGELLEKYLAAQKTVLFEGAQGSLLDIDHGTYPYVTSSNCVAAQAAIGSGIGTKWLKEVLLVSKAYCTRVGEGPFFTELLAEQQEKFRSRGNEFGATTGRARRCGWLDLPALKYAVRINGATGLVITKIDVLAGLGPIKIATSYNAGSECDISFSKALQKHDEGQQITPNYITLPEVNTMPSHIKSLSDFPDSFRALCRLIEEHCKIPITMISFGKERGQELWLK